MKIAFLTSCLLAVATTGLQAQAVSSAGGLGASIDYGTPQQVRQALAQGLDANAPLPGGKTPLMEAAAFNGDPGVIQVLLQAGAEIDARDPLGMTALMWAASGNGHAEVTSALLKGGAEVGVRNRLGATPLILAAQGNPNPAVLSALIAAGAEVAAQDQLGDSALMWAAAGNPNPAIVTVLLDAGADVNATNPTGTTPLMFASRTNPNPDVVATLLRAGARIDAVDSDGRTALIDAAAHSDNPGTVSALLAAKANASVEDASGATALDYAKRNGALTGTTALSALEGAAEAVGAQPQPGPATPQLASSAAAASASAGPPGSLLVTIKPVVGSKAAIKLIVSGSIGERDYAVGPNETSTLDLPSGSYTIEAAFVDDTAPGYTGSAQVIAGRSTPVTIRLAYSPQFMDPVNRKYRSLLASRKTDEDGIAAVRGTHASKIKNGILGEVLGAVAAGAAGYFYYESTSSQGGNTSQDQTFAYVGGVTAVLLLAAGTYELLTIPPSEKEVELKREIRSLDEQLQALQPYLPSEGSGRGTFSHGKRQLPTASSGS